MLFTIYKFTFKQFYGWIPLFIRTLYLFLCISIGCIPEGNGLFIITLSFAFSTDVVGTGILTLESLNCGSSGKRNPSGLCIT